MKKLFAVMFAVMLTVAAFGQDMPPLPTRQAPVPPGGRTESNEVKPCQVENAMIEHEGKLYMVSGARLIKMDIETLEPETCNNLSKLNVGSEAEEDLKKYKAEYLAPYDVNKDGVLSGREVSHTPQIRRMDKNNDGTVTVDEIDAPKAAIPGECGPAVLLISGDKLVMLRSGFVFKFSLDKLELLQYKKVGIKAKDVSGGKCVCASGATETAPKPAGENKTPEPQKQPAPTQ